MGTRVVVEHGYDSRRETLRTSGSLGLAESVDFCGEKRLRYAIGDEDTTFEISKDRFSEGQLIPGAVWVAV